MQPKAGIPAPELIEDYHASLSFAHSFYRDASRWVVIVPAIVCGPDCVRNGAGAGLPGPELASYRAVSRWTQRRRFRGSGKLDDVLLRQRRRRYLED